jgi:hypothetical protein
VLSEIESSNRLCPLNSREETRMEMGLFDALEEVSCEMTKSHF